MAAPAAVEPHRNPHGPGADPGGGPARADVHDRALAVEDQKYRYSSVGAAAAGSIAATAAVKVAARHGSGTGTTPTLA